MFLIKCLRDVDEDTEIVTFDISHRRYSRKKGVLTNSAKFTGKHLCQSVIFNKGLQLH